MGAVSCRRRGEPRRHYAAASVRVLHGKAFTGLNDEDLVDLPSAGNLPLKSGELFAEGQRRRALQHEPITDVVTTISIFGLAQVMRIGVAITLIAFFTQTREVCNMIQTQPFGPCEAKIVIRILTQGKLDPGQRE